MEKSSYGRSGRATECNVIRRKRFACWVNKTISTHSECAILIAFLWQKEITGMCLRYVTRELHVLLHRANPRTKPSAGT
jgi:hypothetical protein